MPSVVKSYSFIIYFPNNAGTAPNLSVEFCGATKMLEGKRLLVCRRRNLTTDLRVLINARALIYTICVSQQRLVRRGLLIPLACKDIVVLLTSRTFSPTLPLPGRRPTDPRKRGADNKIVITVVGVVEFLFRFPISRAAAVFVFEIGWVRLPVKKF